MSMARWGLSTQSEASHVVLWGGFCRVFISMPIYTRACCLYAASTDKFWCHLLIKWRLNTVQMALHWHALRLYQVQTELWRLQVLLEALLNFSQNLSFRQEPVLFEVFVVLRRNSDLVLTWTHRDTHSFGRPWLLQGCPQESADNIQQSEM